METTKTIHKVKLNNTLYKAYVRSFAVLVIASLIGTYVRVLPGLASTSALPNCVTVIGGASTGGQYRTITVTNNCASSYYAKFKVVSEVPGVLPPNRSCICLPPKQSKTLVVPFKFHLEGCTIFASCPI
jgi:hypothetical protein